MGHEVLTAPVPAQWVDHRIMHIMQLGYEKFAPNRIGPQEKWLLKVLPSFKPDVMIALTHAVGEESLLTLQRAGCVNVAWWGDTAANMRNQGLLCYGWDHIFIKDRYAVFKLQTLGLSSSFLPEAMNPMWHKPLYGASNDDVVFAGNTYEYRHFLLRRLLDAGYPSLKLYGNKPPRWADPRITGLYQQKFVVKEEKSKVFGEAHASINSTSMTEGNSINCRTFEIAGAGGLQLMEYRQAIEDCFDPGKEIETFSSVEELIDKLDRYKIDKAAARSIREQASRRAHEEHTYQHRLAHIIKQIRS